MHSNTDEFAAVSGEQGGLFDLPVSPGGPQFQPAATKRGWRGGVARCNRACCSLTHDQAPGNLSWPFTCKRAAKCPTRFPDWDVRHDVDRDPSMWATVITELTKHCFDRGESGQVEIEEVVRIDDVGPAKQRCREVASERRV